MRVGGKKLPENNKVVILIFGSLEYWLKSQYAERRSITTVLCQCRKIPNNHSSKTCSCPFERYFCTLLWDDIAIICWWKLRKQTSYWSKTFFFSVKKKLTIFSSQRTYMNKFLGIENKLLEFEAASREFAKFLRSLNRTIYSNSESSVQFFKQ